MVEFDEDWRPLCWTCDFSTCECGVWTDSPKPVHPAPRNRLGLPMIKPIEVAALPAGAWDYESWRTPAEKDDPRRKPRLIPWA
jgi:hypothetical protein